jgi:CubicO group peptidase (beta-lactamase class C family)
MKILLSILLLSIGVFAQNVSEKLNEKLREMQVKSGFPGFAVAIVNEKGVLYQNGFGFADVKSKMPYTTRTIQPVGSVSKTVIGAALMKAVEMNLFSLDANVNEILPFKVYNPNFPASEITIKQIAAHTSSIVDREEIYEKTYVKAKKSGVSLGDFLKDYLSVEGKYYSAKNFDKNEPGAAFNYTNIGAALAAYLIETKSGMAFADFTAKYVFAPLEMNRTDWFYNETKAKNYATLYDAKRKPLPVYSSITYPDGSLKTSVEDLSKYLREIIKGYSGEGKILSKSSFQTMLDKQFAADKLPLKINPKEPNQGVFFVHRKNGLIGHTGSDPGVSAFMFFNPTTKIGKIFITNIDIGEDAKLAAQFVEIWQVLEENENSFN